MSMHGLIRERLEEYLRQTPGKALPLQFEEHLRGCEECREELSWMQEQCRQLRILRPTRQMDAAPGFYARVMERIEAQQQTSFWNAFLDPVFGKRLVAASLALAVMLVGYLAMSEVGTVYTVPASAESIMAVDEHPPGLGADRDRDRSTMLVTLATYHGGSYQE